MEQSALMITGGSADPAFASDFIVGKEYDAILAVDGGLALCHDIGLIPTHLIGDFDTVEEGLLERYLHLPGIRVIRHSPIKDATDTELALTFCLDSRITSIHILGGTGTRIDHSIANIQILLHALKAGVSCVMYDAHNKIYLTDRGIELEREAQYGNYVSLLPLTETVRGVTLRGFKYSLDNVDFHIGSSLGVSNEITDSRASISFLSGIFLVVEAKD